MIWTGKPRRISTNPVHDLRAAMSTSVLKRVDLSVGAAVDDDSPLTKIAGHIVTGIRNLLFQGQVLPVWPAEDAIQLMLIQLRIKKQLELNVRAVFPRPQDIEAPAHFTPLLTSLISG